MEIMTIRSSGGGRDSGGGGVLGLALITDMLSQKKAKYNEVEIRIEDKQRVEAKGEAMGKQAKRASGSDGDGDSDGGVSELPHDLIVEVLRRLPTKSLMRCQCVSKLWCSTIRHPDFLKARSRFRFRRFRIEIPSNTFLLDYQPPGIARSFLP